MDLTSQELRELGTNLVEKAERQGATLRLLGGLACYLNSPEARKLPGLVREYGDLDFVVDRGGSRRLTGVFRDAGWTDDHYFNALHGATRLMYHYGESLQADVFVRIFAQCHRIDFKDTLAFSKPTIPLAELLLTKLQVHKINEKDVKDVAMLAHDHHFGRLESSEKPDLERILKITSNDWGWYTTVRDNLDAIASMVDQYLDEAGSTAVMDTLVWLRKSIDDAPKSVKWKMRDRVGRRIRWYEEPEEVNR